MRRILLSICAALSMSVGALIASDAEAASTDCTLDNPITGATVGNIVVPEDQTCNIPFGTTVNGNIVQQSNSQLFIPGGVIVYGNGSSQGGTPALPTLYLSGGLDSLNRISALISGTSAGVRLPRGGAAR
jgi:hypothetical protein